VLRSCRSCESHRVFLYAFDLIELNDDDLRHDPLEVRKATLRSMLAKVGLGLRFNEHLEGAHALQDGTRRHRVEAQGLDVSLRLLAGLAQNEEPDSTSGEARRGRRMRQKETAMNGKNRIMMHLRCRVQNSRRRGAGHISQERRRLWSGISRNECLRAGILKPCNSTLLSSIQTGDDFISRGR
jgi:hypothetical protein